MPESSTQSQKAARPAHHVPRLHFASVALSFCTGRKLGFLSYVFPWGQARMALGSIRMGHRRRQDCTGLQVRSICAVAWCACHLRGGRSAAESLDVGVGRIAKPNSSLDFNTRFILNTFEQFTAYLVAIAVVALYAAFGSFTALNGPAYLHCRRARW